MTRNTRYLLIICIIAVLGAFALQFLWIRNYYIVNKASFEKEVNLAFEDAIKKELALRCDTIQGLIAKKLLDTNEFSISNKFSAVHHKYEYMLTAVRKKHDIFSVGYIDKDFNKQLLPSDTSFRKRVAAKMALYFREEDLEKHMIYYRTQTLGNFMSAKAEQYAFDTARLRPVFKNALAERNIHVPFKFYLRENDNTLNANYFSKKLIAHYPVITKAYPTYINYSKDRFVRAMFVNPFWYIIKSMALLFAGSILLIAVVAFSLFTLFRSLLTEKKLSLIKNDFISNITHELKTPIAGASAAIEAITNFDILKDEEKTRKYLGYSKAELQKLSALVERVLNISIYEKQLLGITPRQINPDDVVPAILLKHRQLSAKTVNYNYTNEGVKTVVADKMYFEHAINNLVDNAVKYSGDQVEINITVTAQQNYVQIAVKDNGKGIAYQDQQLVFEKFYRVTNGNLHAIKGHGLGLSYVKSIIERHNGWCKLVSEPGIGSTFTLAWPA